jgi:hypothetical protein
MSAGRLDVTSLVSGGARGRTRPTGTDRVLPGAHRVRPMTLVARAPLEWCARASASTAPIGKPGWVSFVEMTVDLEPLVGGAETLLRSQGTFDVDPGPLAGVRAWVAGRRLEREAARRLTMVADAAERGFALAARLEEGGRRGWVDAPGGVPSGSVRVVAASPRTGQSRPPRP